LSTHLATDVAVAAERDSLRVRAVSMLGPLAVCAGAVWGLLQPYRITLLHPHGQGFWWLAVEPPLLVVLAGILFHLLVVPGVLADLREAEGR
jgi:hypothetical protein